MDETRAQVSAERLDDTIAVMVRLDSDLVRSMTAVDQMNLGSLVHGAALRLLAQTTPSVPADG